ncbi:hypothetical protein M758_12G120100 [Ceratodon purpureus]|nr:hypothetical protein M758_12G120100 [Ceratodon purpureus]
MLDTFKTLLVEKLPVITDKKKESEFKRSSYIMIGGFSSTSIDQHLSKFPPKRYKSQLRGKTLNQVWNCIL